jgi:hypothetical protein
LLSCFSIACFGWLRVQLAAYIGTFEWGVTHYWGSHEQFISTQLFETVQAVIHGPLKGKYGKHDIAFQGMMNFARSKFSSASS